MKCDVCGERKSVIHVQQIIGSEVIELHLCEACAEEKGIRGTDDKLELSLSHLLTGLVDVKSQARKQQEQRLVCPNCGTSFASFRKSGRLGCAECFGAFRKEISGLFEKMENPAQHKGKYPRKLLAYKQFFVDRERLKEQLAAAVADEAYEKAAEIRDRMRKLDESSGVAYD